MNIHIKSHSPLSRLREEGDAMATVTPFENSRSKVLKQLRLLHVQRNLLQANKRIEKFIGHQSIDSGDPFGGVLRRLRSQQGLDASVVASKACISVRQLYELETGKDTLFYTPGLRHKAAQRVAELLGSHWTDILQGLVAVNPVTSPKAHIHVLKTPLTEICLGNKQTQEPPSPSPIQGADKVSDKASDEASGGALFSSALFLRVQDSKNQVPGGL